MSPAPDPGGKPNAVAVVLLGMMELLAGGSVRRESVTVDEVAHVGAGVSYLQALDLRMNEEHPPRAKVLAAIPLVLRGAHADYSHLSWSFSQGFFKQFLGEWVFGHWLLTRWNDPVTTLFWARMPILSLTVALGFVLNRYGAKLGSPMGGLLCLCSYATMPAFLTFGPPRDAAKIMPKRRQWRPTRRARRWNHSGKLKAVHGPEDIRLVTLELHSRSATTSTDDGSHDGKVSGCHSREEEVGLRTPRSAVSPDDRVGASVTRPFEEHSRPFRPAHVQA